MQRGLGFVLLLGTAVALGLVGAGCDGAPAAPPPAGRLRLWTVPTARLVESAPPGELATVFQSDFSADLSGWLDLFLPFRTDLADAHLEKSVVPEDGTGFLRLAGRHGGLRTVVPVEPSTCYVFHGRVRANDLEVGAGTFGGATYYLAEARIERRLEELLTTEKESLVRRHLFPSARGRDGWQELERVIVTGPDTRFLHIVCSLATDENVLSGSVDYQGVRLERALGPSVQWYSALAHTLARRAGIDPPTAEWQRERAVSARLGGEYRPSIVLLPGDRLCFTLGALPRGARLGLGFGPWREAWPAGPSTQTLRIRADEVELFAATRTLPARAAEARWEALELDLARFATGDATLELSCSGDAPLVLGAPVIRGEGPRPAGPNVLLISIDTLRADHLGAYGYRPAGYPEGVSPRLDELARTGVLCRDASAQAPYTLPSHATLLTGQLPSVHGVVAHERTLSAARSATLAETLGRAGYVTQAFAAGGFVNQHFGLDRGFEGFTEVDPIRGRDSHYFRRLCQRQGDSVAETLLADHGFESLAPWFRAHRDRPFFVFLHTYTVHDFDAPLEYLRCTELGCARPWLPQLRTDSEEAAQAFTAEQRAHVLHRYDAAVRFTDGRIGTLLDSLAELGLAQDTLVVVTSDHGEEFFEHGALQHGRTLYEELLRVPLLFHGPGLAPRVIERPVMLADVTPTLLARLGLPPDPRMQGVDLLGRDWPARGIWSEVDDVFAHKLALREEGGFKLIHGPASEVQFPNTKEWELFDLTGDPREQRDLAAVDAKGLEARRAALEHQRQLLEALGNSLGTLGTGEMDEESLQELEDLGYGGVGK